MYRFIVIVITLFIAVVSEQAMTESKLNQEQDEPLFMAVKNRDPAFAQAIQQSQASLPVFRAMLAAPALARSTGAIRMVKTRIVDGNESMWLWLIVEADKSNGFTASVFEAPHEFPSLKPGVFRTIPNSEVADWAVIDGNGLVHGGYSLRLQRSRRPESERAAYDSYIGAKTYAPLPP